MKQNAHELLHHPVAPELHACLHAIHKHHKSLTTLNSGAQRIFKYSMVDGSPHRGGQALVLLQ